MRKIRLAAAAAMLAMGATHATAQGTFIALDGGANCTTGKAIIDAGNFKLGDNGCGGRGGVEVGRTGAQVYGIFDHWAIRGRFATTNDKADGGTFVISFPERRSTLDAEVGAKTPFGLFGGVSRVTLGLRYGAWQGKLFATDGIDSVGTTFDTAGFGPRIGMRSSIPLGNNFLFESMLGASALFSTGKGVTFENGVVTDSVSRRGTVYSIDSMSLLSYQLNGTTAGPVISVGIASDYNFNQVLALDNKLNRHSFGPVARFRMPLQ
jgi:hypothetical protein